MTNRELYIEYVIKPIEEFQRKLIRLYDKRQSEELFDLIDRVQSDLLVFYEKLINLN